MVDGIWVWEPNDRTGSGDLDFEDLWGNRTSSWYLHLGDL